MSDFDSIEKKFSMVVEIDALNIFLKFDFDKLISGFAPTRIKKFS